MSDQDRLLSYEELKQAVLGIIENAAYMPLKSSNDFINLINTQKRLYAESELEKFKANNHIGYAYQSGEVTDNYIVLERVVKKGKNWVLRVQCRWCGSQMNRMTNKFNMKHIDCKEWGVNMRLCAEQKARIN